MGVVVTVTVHKKEVIDAMDKVARHRMDKAVAIVQRKIYELFAEPKTGRTYYIPGTRTTYTASAPGEPPARATRELNAGIKRDMTDDGTIGIVGTDVKHGTAMEFGTRRGDRLPVEPRPWLRPAFEQSEQEIRELFTEKWF